MLVGWQGETNGGQDAVSSADYDNTGSEVCSENETVRPAKRPFSESLLRFLGKSSSRESSSTLCLRRQDSDTLQAILDEVNESLEMLPKVMNTKDTDVTPELSQLIVKCTLELQKEYLEKKAPSPGCRTHDAQIIQEVCRLLDVSPTRHTTVMQQFLTYGTLYASGKDRAGRSGSTTTKGNRVELDDTLLPKVREFVRTKHKDRRRFPRPEYLVDQDANEVATDTSNTIQGTSLRTVRRLVFRAGYKRGKKSRDLKFRVDLSLKRDILPSTLTVKQGPETSAFELCISMNRIFTGNITWVTPLTIQMTRRVWTMERLHARTNGCALLVLFKMPTLDLTQTIYQKITTSQVLSPAACGAFAPNDAKSMLGITTWGSLAAIF